jgi:hypothetical protein
VTNISTEDTAMDRLYWRDVGLAMGCFLAITYVFCVGYDLAFDQRMYEVWLKLLPGFTWLTWQSFLVGLVESFLYGIYFGLVFVPLYNFFHGR